MRLLYYLSLVAAFTVVTRPASAATTISARPAKTIAPLERSVSNNLVTYDFLFLPSVNSNKEGVHATYDSLSRTIVIKFRVRISGFAESPLRYHLTAIEDYEARLKFFAFDFNHNISLYQDSSACQQVAYSLDANLNAGPFETFVVAYKLAKPLDETIDALHLQMDDPVLFGGIVDVIIKKDELQ